MKVDYPCCTHPSATVLQKSLSENLDLQILVRLACLIHAASVRSEPGSNSPYDMGSNPRLPASPIFDPCRPARLGSGRLQELTRLNTSCLYLPHRFWFEAVLHECLFHFPKSKNAQNPVSLSLFVKGLSEPCSGRTSHSLNESCRESTRRLA